MTTPTPTRSPSTQEPVARRPAKEGAVRKVSRGGWFIAEDVNGEPVVVRLPGRVEIGA